MTTQLFNKALRKFMYDLGVNNIDQKTSLMKWRETDPDASQIDAAEWLRMSVCHIQSVPNFKLDLVAAPPRPGERFSHTFSDARVSCGA
jgi:hypothetical protein